MSFPTRLQVKTRYLQRLDQQPLVYSAGPPVVYGDPPGAVFTDAVFQEAFGEAYDAMFSGFLRYQCEAIEIVQSGIIVPPGTTSLTPAQMGITNFSDVVYLAERTAYSTENFRDLTPNDRLSQRQPADRLLEYDYRGGTFYFVGATTVRELQIEYESSGSAPTVDTAQILVDSSLTFLSNYAVGVSARQKGYDEIGNECMRLAVGSRYDQGIIGGELFGLIQPLVRARQEVQIARKPFSASRRSRQRVAVPFVAAQPSIAGVGVSRTPVSFSSAQGTILGTINGVNPTFVLSLSAPTSMEWYRNGLLQTPSVAYVATGNSVTFTTGHIPQTSDVLTCEATF